MNKLLFLGKGVLLLCLFATHFVQAQTVSTAYATQINATFAPPLAQASRLCPDSSDMLRFDTRFDSEDFQSVPTNTRKNNCDEIAAFLAMTF